RRPGRVRGEGSRLLVGLLSLADRSTWPEAGPGAMLRGTQATDRGCRQCVPGTPGAPPAIRRAHRPGPGVLRYLGVGPVISWKILVTERVWPPGGREEVTEGRTGRLGGPAKPPGDSDVPVAPSPLRRPTFLREPSAPSSRPPRARCPRSRHLSPLGF